MHPPPLAPSRAMPHLFSFATHANDDALQDFGPDDLPAKRLRRQSLLRKPLNLLKRHIGETHTEPTSLPATAPTELAHIPEYFPPRRPSLPENVSSKRAVPSLPRPQTFRRQNSERRERLLPVEPTPDERRTLSADRRRSRGISASGTHRPLSPRPVPIPSISAPNVGNTDPNVSDTVPTDANVHTSGSPTKASRRDLPPLQIPEFEHDPLIDESDDDYDHDDIEPSPLREEFERRWLLNLTMNFRDKSRREKFFVTYAEKPNQWRRVTVSLDYRNAPPDSLEADLSTLHFQQDKSFRIYEAIRDSLPEIQYYDTVTNLKLETTADDGQLHVHVREDANEIVEYPPMSVFAHVQCPRFNEGSLEIVKHLSGFVYKVKLGDRILIKKEIPGPDTVDEYLYEVNALDSLLGADNVIQLEGLVTDDRGELAKGLLISYATQGALVDMIYQCRGTIQWHRREKWAKQVVTGLAEIHEAGFVQGDFTLSNIVLDGEDDAHIIDINRRGCPVGWEPPELGKLIDSAQRISMHIGVKTDLFQLGMVLWALAEEVDEPERVERPLLEVYDEIPAYFRNMIKICLSERPQGRMGAKQLLRLFPDNAGAPPTPSKQMSGFPPKMQVSDHSESTITHRSAKEYIDPDLAVTIDEVKDCRRVSSGEFTAEQVAYVNADSNPASSTYRFESSGSWVIGRRSRGRSPVSSRRRRSSPYGRTVSSATSLSENSPSRKEQANASAFDRRPTFPIANRIADLLHVDSGFDETMDPDADFEEFDPDSSCLTDRQAERRPKTYIPDDEDDVDDELPNPPETPASFHTAVEGGTPRALHESERYEERSTPIRRFSA